MGACCAQTRPRPGDFEGLAGANDDPGDVYTLPASQQAAVLRGATRRASATANAATARTQPEQTPEPGTTRASVLAKGGLLKEKSNAKTYKEMREERAARRKADAKGDSEASDGSGFSASSPRMSVLKHGQQQHGETGRGTDEDQARARQDAASSAEAGTLTGSGPADAAAGGVVQTPKAESSPAPLAVEAASVDTQAQAAAKIQAAQRGKAARNIVGNKRAETAKAKQAVQRASLESVSGPSDREREAAELADAKAAMHGVGALIASREQSEKSDSDGELFEF
eukprot:TRINITY_DN41029_c0_g1_i1.p1 TRINITY_DN41029_c0_g1~~TRINITY_DN41029_c0_g1_i1.p1  ORF type:complete len:284 (+),score=71.20 TRINITY_DN41029_c0_g1_i1:150-1001(+)